jgi:hypothetical protein
MADESVELELAILKTLDCQGEISDSVEFAREHGYDHTRLASVTLSLDSTGYVVRKVLSSPQLAII